jgi:hypothetical protein
VSPFERGALAAAWTRDACAEHASVASFARFSLDLLALGAPADLVADAHRAALDEIEHARLCFELASAYGGAPVGPGRLAVDGAAVRADLASAAVAAVHEGCVGETEAALLAQAQMDGARDPRVRRALLRIAADEADHAALAWRFVAWALRCGGEQVGRAVEAAFEEVSTMGETPDPPAEGAPPGVRPEVWSAHGRLAAAEVARVRARARRDVVGPSARLLPGAGAPGRSPPPLMP